MAQFTYYLPKESKADAETISRYGLTYALDPRKRSIGQVSANGPDGGAGLLATMAPDPPKYDASSQTWRKAPKADYWVGKTTAATIGPEDLARDRMLSGEWIELGDGNEWLAPYARRFDPNEGTYVQPPGVSSFDFDDEGEWIVGNVRPKYRELWGVATWFWAELAKATEVGDVSLPGAVDRSIVALQANYRISKTEAVVLGLLDESTVFAVLGAAVDLSTVREWEDKKKEAAPDGGDSDAGVTGSRPTTRQLAPTS